jgi:hypothetical protein
MKKTLLITGLALALLAPAVSLAAAKEAGGREPWIHVEVREGGGDRATVNVNVPFALADAALASLGDDIGSHITFGHHNGRHAHAGDAAEKGEGESVEGEHGGEGPSISIADLRRMWKAMRDSGEADYVTVKDDNEKVHIWREGDLVRVDVEDRTGEDQGERVQIRVPVGVMDALLSGDGDQLDVRAAVDGLKDLKDGEIVRVEGGGDFVRVWIDDSPDNGSRE